MVNPASQSVGIQPRMDATDGVRTTGRLRQPALPEGDAGEQFQSVAASPPGPEHHRRPFHHVRRGEAWWPPAIGKGSEDRVGEGENLFGIGDPASKNGLGFPCLEPFPFQLGNFCDQPLQRLLVVDGLPDALLPVFGNADRAGLTGMALNPVQGLVPLTGGAMATGFATLSRAIGPSAAKKPLAGGELGDAGREVALGGGAFGGTERGSHGLYIDSIQDNRENPEQTGNTNLLYGEPGLKQ